MLGQFAQMPSPPCTSSPQKESARASSSGSASLCTSLCNPLLRGFRLFFRLLFLRLFLFSFLFLRFFLSDLPRLLEKLLLLLLQRRASRQIFFAVKVNAPVNQRFLRDRVRAQRIAVVNHQVRVLAHLDGPHALLDAQLNRWIQRDQFYR